MEKNVAVRPMLEADLEAADRVMRLAFGTFLKLPDPLQVMGDADCVRTRWRANPAAAFCAEAGGVIVGSVFVGNWESVGFFGPLTVHPDYWDQGVAARMAWKLTVNSAMRVDSSTRMTKSRESMVTRFGMVAPRILRMPVLGQRHRMLAYRKG